MLRKGNRIPTKWPSTLSPLLLLLLPLLCSSLCQAATNSTYSSSSCSPSSSSSSASPTPCSSSSSSASFTSSSSSSSSASSSSLRATSHDYCIIGAGPAGLQMGYFLQTAGRDYVIFERANHSGSFFSEYPRHRRLISINKRYTGTTNAEFNMRHDWNSLLSHDPSLLFKHFSSEFFPEADAMVRYLGEFAERLGLRVRYNTAVRELRRHPESAAHPQGHFSLRDQHGRPYSCRTVVVATGMNVPSAPNFPGAHLTMGYEVLPTDPAFYEGKKVLILGRGNAAFETASAIYGATDYVHMVSRSRARFSWNTHYVGDLRSVNSGLIDTYQLKSLDGLIEASVEDMVLERRNGKIFVQVAYDEAQELKKDDDDFEHKKAILDAPYDNFCFREGYDIVLRCLGFKFDFSIFHNSTLAGPSAKKPKYPAMKSNFEAQSVPGLYFAGTATHSLDYRKSAGGFIHGFRYTVRALHRLLEWRLEGRRWPVSSHGLQDFMTVLVKRLNEASGTYQMFGELADIVLLRDGGRKFELLEEFPVHLLAQLEDLTGREVGELVVVLMEYGPDFSGPDKDTFRTDRAIGNPIEAHRSNFLHPVLYYYKRLPTEAEMMNKWGKSPLPRPIRIHHIIEDFLTQWTAQQSHILPLRRFFEFVLGTDLRHYYAHTCLSHALTTGSAPRLCRRGAAPSVWPSHGLVREPLDGSSGTPEFVSDNTLPSVLPVTPGSATAALASATS